MKWFKKIVWRMHRWASEDHEEFAAQERANALGTIRRTRGGTISSSKVNHTWDEMRETNDPNIQADSMTFKLYTCVGGYILETQVYNKRDDENQHTLYMIKEEDDFAKQVSQSIMMEMMKQ